MVRFLQWAALFPGAILGAVVCTFLLRLVLYQTLTGSGLIEPYPESIERILTPLALAIGVVWAGSKIAPSYNFKVAVALCGLWILMTAGMATLALVGTQIGDGQLHLKYGGVSSVFSIAGAVLGLLIVRGESNQKRKDEI